MLDSVVFTCSPVVNFSLYLEHEEDNTCLIYFPLMERAYWSSLKALELGGSVQLFDSQGNSTDTYASFLARHSQIHYLSFEVIGENDVKTLQTHIPPHILPHLRALQSSFPLHLDIFTRSQHIRFANILSRYFFVGSISAQLHYSHLWS